MLGQGQRGVISPLQVIQKKHQGPHSLGKNADKIFKHQIEPVAILFKRQPCNQAFGPDHRRKLRNHFHDFAPLVAQHGCDLAAPPIKAGLILG